MSDDNNSTEGLNREEERSDENSVASSQLRDFMISDNAYSAGVDSKEEKEEVGSRNPVELTNPLAEETLGSTAKVTAHLGHYYFFPLSTRARFRAKEQLEPTVEVA